MAYVPFNLCCLLVLFFPIFALSQNNNNYLLVGSSLVAKDNAKPWLSPSSDFAFGFQQMQGGFLLSIWYYNIPDKTIVWYANYGNTVREGSKVELNADNGLVLTNSEGKEVWTSGPAQSDEVFGATLNDTGNFIIYNRDSTKLWDSFSTPTDTLLPTQTMETNSTLKSRLTETDFSKGRFQLRFSSTNGTLVLSVKDTVTNNAYATYNESENSDKNESNQGYHQVQFSTTGDISIVKRDGAKVLINNNTIPRTGVYYRATLNYDGVFVLYYHPKDFRGTPANWTAVWQIPENICTAFYGIEDVGSEPCGFNSICRLDDTRRVDCQCPKSYPLIDPNDKHSSCKPNFTQNCDDFGSSEDLYDFEVLIDTDWPHMDYSKLQPITEADCIKRCLDDCVCAVAIYRGDACWFKKLPLSNGRYDKAINGKAFLKYSKVNRLAQGDPTFQGKKKDAHNLFLLVLVLLSSSVFVNLILTLVACFGFFYIYSKRNANLQPADVETNVRRFTNNELIEATNGLKEELGRGAFGIVYKGVIQMSSTIHLVAVKKIDRFGQDGVKEFKTEVNVIAQTHHRNLVRLVGFCEEDNHRLLVYEYMVNGSLASLIFGNVKPSWALRKCIALGIARGLAYLHNECSTQIIHCDIKPQNILLDDYYNARISDFGLAKLMMLNQSKTNTGIRGTKGYVAPEWFRINSPVTVKVDVYSFGVLLLEIICCRRSVEDPELGDDAILTDWVWDCFEEGRMVDLVKNNDQEDVMSDWEKVEIYLKVGIWCIQEDPSLRPTMRKVIQMLEGDVHVSDPPCPSPYT